ncbi:MAG: formate/nitrite transporter family protein [Treponema sp.]
MINTYFYDPAEILDITIQKGMLKVANPVWKQFILGFSAGAFVGFAGSGANMAAFGLLADPAYYGLGKLVSGFVFPVGLMLILICGSELFTGNCLITAAVLEKKVRFSALLKNWFLVYFGNFAGAFTVAFLVVQGGQLEAGSALLGGVTVSIAYSKMTLGFLQAVMLGILCNWLVCSAVWICYAAKDVAGTLFAAFFPIMLFAVSSFEHCVANMYYVPAGLMAKSAERYIAAAGIGTESLAELTWMNFIFKNLVPVTIGNIIGGVFFVAVIYTFCYRKR